MGKERYLELRPYYERALAGETVSYESVGAAGNATGCFRFSYRPIIDEQGHVRGIFLMATTSPSGAASSSRVSRLADTLPQGSGAVRVRGFPRPQRAAQSD